MKTLYSLFVVVLAAVAVTACKKPPPPEAERIVPRNDFAPEEFGIGRAHTKNFACNREIDGYLEEIRKCYNAHNMEACEGLHRQRSEKINRLKNAAHCAHGNAQR
jgi:hypothetical protein